MNELTALKWLEGQEGLKILVGAKRKITLTDGFHVEVTGIGLLDAVFKLQTVLREMT